MTKKYKLRKKHFVTLADGTKLYQIKALKNFGNVIKGDLGGYVESEENLSQEGEAWVYNKAKVYGQARVFGDAWVFGYARVYGRAWVYNNARVYNKAKVYDEAKVSGYTRIFWDTPDSGDDQVN